MTRVVAAQRRHRVMPTPEVSGKSREILLKYGEYYAAEVLGVGRSVAIKAAARMPLTRADHDAIVAGLAALEQGAAR